MSVKRKSAISHKKLAAIVVAIVAAAVLAIGAGSSVLTRRVEARVDQALQQAEAQIAAQNYRGAYATLDELLKLTPEHAEALTLRDQVSQRFVPDPFDFSRGAKTGAEAQASQRIWAAHRRVAVETTNGIGMKLVLIPPGIYLCGSPATEALRRNDETQHRVRISRPFLMQTTEATQAQWKAVMGNNPSQSKGDDLPVEMVSWNDAVAFCERLTQRERQAGRIGADQSYRLPTEAQWEYACRAGTTTTFNTGATISTDQANYDGNYLYGNGRKGAYRQKTVPVGIFKPNAWGLYDMHGNVYERCADWYADYVLGEATDPTGATTGQSRVVRGGGWHGIPQFCRAAYRHGDAPDYRYDCRGFRVVCVSVGGPGLP